MRVLIACEESQVVLEEFRKLGHEAFSCDILEPSGNMPEYHFQQDLLPLLKQDWDLIIAFPPCTYLSNSGVRWLYNKDKSLNTERWSNMKKGALFFKTILDSDCDKIAIENPIMHKYSKEIIGRSQDQIIHPWQFGHGETKATCLWLKNLPKLIPTDIVEGREQRIWKLPPSKDRQKLRSKTYVGIAKAMASQWG